MKPRVLVTGRIPEHVLAQLKAECEVDSHTADIPLSATELIDRVRDKHALVCQIVDTVDESVVAAAQELKVIANIAVGYDNIDVTAAQRRGIVVTNTPDVLTEATADYTFGLILAITRRIPEAERFVRSGQWRVWKIDFMLGSELRHKQLGIVGFGRIGRAVAARARAFNMRVAFTDALKLEVEDAQQMALDDLLRTSDVLSLHLTHSSAAVHLIDAEKLNLLKPSAYLVNMSRGGIVDDAALAAKLRNGTLAGAALDVYENEPHIHPDLMTLENVLLSPHIGSASVETRTRMIEMAVNNALAVVQGKPPLTPIPRVA